MSAGAVTRSRTRAPPIEVGTGVGARWCSVVGGSRFALASYKHEV